MSYTAKVLKDSISPAEIRLTTIEVTFPRFILAEVNTHRAFSRNSASSRAIPPEKIIERVVENPFLPEFNKRVRGMGVGAPLIDTEAELADKIWLGARDAAVSHANMLLSLDVDKSRVNRLLEPFMWHTALISATEWSNFFALRTDEGAQPEFRNIAYLMLDAWIDSDPELMAYGGWHMPLVREAEIAEYKRSHDVKETIDYWKRVSVGRCARVSYLTHDGVRDPEADIELYERLCQNGHLSPFEHVATPQFMTSSTARRDVAAAWSGNFFGWKQHRKEIVHEYDFGKAKAMEVV